LHKKKEEERVRRALVKVDLENIVRLQEVSWRQNLGKIRDFAFILPTLAKGINLALVLALVVLLPPIKR
jgi:type IV secretory pathway component VirB8